MGVLVLLVTLAMLTGGVAVMKIFREKMKKQLAKEKVQFDIMPT